MKKNKYYIEELQSDATYIELRILTYIECEEKIMIITRILNFLNSHKFLTNLTMLYHTAMRSENLPERENVASLTLDMRDEKFRFKYWDGSKIYWTYHVEDLFNVLIEGRKEYQKLVDKYSKITQILFDIKDKYYSKIVRVSYKYYPHDDIDIQYDIQFSPEMKDQQAETDTILKEIFNSMPKEEDLNFNIDYSFKKTCIPCQKRRQEKENGQSN